VRKTIKNDEINASGCYVVTLCVNGYSQDIIIDDFLPVNPGSSQVAFARSREQDGKGAIWVSLIEKAWAKLNGNYDRVSMGTVDLGFIHLLGVPSLGYKHLELKNAQGREFLWGRLIDAQNNGHLMTSGTADSTLKTEELMRNNLRANHCYTVL
jgi:hypothetical protein